MDQNEKVATDKISKMENEIKVLKNEVQAVLLDLRESYLNMENPFGSGPSPAPVQSIVITERAPTKESRPDNLPKDRANAENAESEKSSAAESPKPEALQTGEHRTSEGLPITGPDAEITREETEKALSLHSQPETRTAKSAPGMRRNCKLELATVAGLTGWVEQSCQKIGRERTEAVLDISEAMGYVPGELRPILLKLITLAPPISVESPARTRDYIDSLIKLNSLFGQDNREESALLLLSLISGEANHG